VVLALAGSLGSLGCPSTTEPTLSAFDSKTWKDLEQANREPYPRRAMADHLLQQRTLHGKSRAEVLDLLGEPSDTEHFAEYDAVYWLGPQRSMVAIDSEWLVIRFGESERVTEAKLVTD